MAEQEQQLTQAEVLAQLRVRGFESGFQRSPLRDFTGRLMSITGHMVTFGNTGRSSLEILYNFNEVEVLPGGSTEPYPFPAAQIGIFQSTRDKSNMGYFAKSVDNIINAGVAENEPETLADGSPNPAIKKQDYLIGKVLHMKLTGGHMIWDGNAKDATNLKGKEMPKECWEVLAVDGIGAAPTIPLPVAGMPVPAASPQPVVVKVTQPVGAAGQALKLLHGKTEQQFYQVAFADPVIKGDGNMVSAILARNFLSPLEVAGTVTKDASGIYHVVGM